MRAALVAGEASGDLLAAHLLQGLRRRWPALRAGGVGGPRMAQQGFDVWWPSEALAVRGYVEVLRHYRRIAALRRELAARLLRDPPQVFIGVDAPDFNLGLEATLKTAGVPTVHFICPSVWAWRGGRAARLGRSCDLVLCVFPFEPALLQRHGVKARYVGHPLADAMPLVPDRAAARRALGLADGDAVLAVLPGSRRSEIERIAPAFVQTAALLQQRRPGLRCVLPVAPGLRAEVEAAWRRHAPALDLRLLDGASHQALAACDAALVASGTATLEAALSKRPLVVAYRMQPLSWQIMKRMRYQPWVGLPNILCGEFVVPEFLQEECRPALLADALGRALDDTAAAERLGERMTALHETLRRDTARRAVDAIADTLRA